MYLEDDGRAAKVLRAAESWWTWPMKDAKVTNWLAKRGKFDHLRREKKGARSEKGICAQFFPKNYDWKAEGTGFELWQRPKSLSQLQAWTVTYGQIIFTLNPLFCIVLLHRMKHRHITVVKKWKICCIWIDRLDRTFFILCWLLEKFEDDHYNISTLKFVTVMFIKHKIWSYEPKFRKRLGCRQK